MTDLHETEHESFRLPSNKDIPIWRYMDLAKYLSILDRRCLFFARATTLGDPFEGSSTKMMVAGREYRREYLKENRATDPKLAPLKDLPDEMFTTWGNGMARAYKAFVPEYLVSCWHMNEHESAAMWKLYSSSHDAVCIRSTYRRLRQCLPQCVFIGEVNYINCETEVFSERNTFNFIMHKRLSFEHERELRAIFWEKHGIPEAESYKAQIEPAGLAIEVDLPALIESVYVSPMAAPWFGDLVKAMTTRCGFAFPVSQSMLAAEPLY